MNANTQRTQSATSLTKPAVAYNLTILIILLAAVASTGGLIIPNLYREPLVLSVRKPVVAFLILMALMLSALWLGQIIPFLTSGAIPAGIEQGGNFQYVYSLDLGLVVPLSLLGALWLGQRRPWGYILSGFILIKAATMGLALLAMSWFTLRAGLPVELELNLVWALIAACGLGLSVWFLKHCQKSSSPHDSGTIDASASAADHAVINR